MKFSIQLIASVAATHYRAGSYEYKQNGATLQGEEYYQFNRKFSYFLLVRRTMGWRRGFAGYGDGCTEDHVNNEIVR